MNFENLKKLAIGIVAAIVIISVMDDCSMHRYDDSDVIRIDTVVKYRTIIDTVFERDTTIIYKDNFVYIEVPGDGVATNIDTTLIYDFEFKDTSLEIYSTHFMSLIDDTIYSDSFKIDYTIEQELKYIDRYKVIEKEVEISKEIATYPLHFNIGGGLGYSFVDRAPSLLFSSGVSFKRNHINLIYDPFRNFGGVIYMRSLKAKR